MSHHERCLLRLYSDVDKCPFCQWMEMFSRHTLLVSYRHDQEMRLFLVCPRPHVAILRDVQNRMNFRIQQIPKYENVQLVFQPMLVSITVCICETILCGFLWACQKRLQSSAAVSENYSNRVWRIIRTIQEGTISRISARTLSCPVHPSDRWGRLRQLVTVLCAKQALKNECHCDPIRLVTDVNKPML